MLMVYVVTQCDVTKLHRINGGTTDEAFQEQCFLWERGALVSMVF